jgi:hypothetical protein
MHVYLFDTIAQKPIQTRNGGTEGPKWALYTTKNNNETQQYKPLIPDRPLRKTYYTGPIAGLGGAAKGFANEIPSKITKLTTKPPRDK